MDVIILWDCDNGVSLSKTRHKLCCYITYLNGSFEYLTIGAQILTQSRFSNRSIFGLCFLVSHNLVYWLLFKVHIKLTMFYIITKYYNFIHEKKMPQNHTQKTTFNKKHANIVAKKTRQINLKHVTHRIGCIFVFITAASKAVSHFFLNLKKINIMILLEKKQ